MNIYTLYKTTNKVNQKIYIGVHHETMWPELDAYLGSGLALSRAIKKHGVENFVRTVLVVCNDADYAYKLERQYVNEEFITDDMNYNLCGGGCGVSVMGEEHKDKIRVKVSGERNGMFGVCGDKHPNWGKRQTDETKQKISEAKRGKTQGKHSVETLTKIKASNTGLKRSNETKQKMSESAKNRKRRPQTEETKRKIKKALVGRPSKNRKRVCIDGVIFDSQTEAAEYIGVCSVTIINRANSPKFPGYTHA